MSFSGTGWGYEQGRAMTLGEELASLVNRAGLVGVGLRFQGRTTT
jgi:hypothetical protein